MQSLLLKTYNHSAEARTLLALDHSGFTERIVTDADDRLIDSVTTLDNQILVPDSTASIGMVAEGGEGKRSLVSWYARSKVSGWITWQEKDISSPKWIPIILQTKTGL